MKLPSISVRQAERHLADFPPTKDYKEMVLKGRDECVMCGVQKNCLAGEEIFLHN